MILTDREIMLAIQHKQIIVEPFDPKINVVSSTSLDLTLAEDGSEWIPGVEGQPLRPGAADYRYSQTSGRRRSVKFAPEPFELRPKQFVLGWTKERIELPGSSHIAARVEGKSSLARLGIIVHLTAPTVHAGSKHPIQLEIVNLGEQTILLDAGMKICQLIFEKTLGTPNVEYNGQFIEQGPGGLGVALRVRQARSAGRLAGSHRVCNATFCNALGRLARRSLLNSM